MNPQVARYEALLDLLADICKAATNKMVTTTDVAYALKNLDLCSAEQFEKEWSRQAKEIEHA